ncbi:MAG: propionate--CoA ligase, partial [Burkholderiaceae bacterium]
SVETPESFWRAEAAAIDWQQPFTEVLDRRRAPLLRWFVGGTTNLCHNAIDRHLATRADQVALIHISTETGSEKVFTYRELHEEVNRVAAMLVAEDVGRGDRVLLYMPMVPEALFAMLACTRIGAIHSVVFGGFASTSLASRIDDALPKVILSADAGSRAGKVIPYKALLDAAIDLAHHKPDRVLMLDRGLAPMNQVDGRDRDWATLRDTHIDARVPCVWLEANEPSYILYTSGTTGTPKGVQRDTGGHAVALIASIKYIFDPAGAAGAVDPVSGRRTFFAASDIGWVVGHCYIVYAPLLCGMATVMYEGIPTRGMDGEADPGIWWRIVAKHRVNTMFTAPTAIRVLKKQDSSHLTRHDLSSLDALFLAGEPLDEPTARWIAEGIGKPILDNYWQTETGWPMLAIQRGIDPTMTPRFGSPGKPVVGFKLKLLDEATLEQLGPNRKGVLVIEGPLPPGCMTTVWDDDARFVDTYWALRDDRSVYSTFDWAMRDDDGYYFILGRTDDVINVAGHRLGTREIEESISGHPAIAETAVVGVADALKGQVAIAFAIVRDADLIATLEDRLRLEGEVMATVDRSLGALARPARVHFVSALPKTRSGKTLRRAMQAVCEGRDPGDLTTIEDPGALDQIRDAVRPAS